MPEERGSIYKSTANEIGEALKAKLGGEGFAPKDWSENLNLLGIASEDTEAAINSLKESEGSGERGSILLSTANAIGAMLNKKYNSSRGFSPAEWASATRKMKALETDTKSGGIVNLKGAKEVPLTSLVGTINPTLEGTDTLVATRLGKNLLESDPAFDAISLCMDFGKDITVDSITFSFVANDTISATNTAALIDYRKEDGTHGYKTLANFRDDNNVAWAVNTPQNGRFKNVNTNVTFRYIYIFYTTSRLGYSAFSADNITNWQLEIGSEATTFEEYKEPTTYTANLGRTVYGGSADIVKGEGNSIYVRIDLGSMTWVNNASYPNVFNGSFPYGYMPDNTLDYICEDYTNGDSTAVITNNMMAAISADRRRLYCHNDSYTQADDFKESVSGKYIVFKCTEQGEDFTFDPIPINTSGDTENFYTSHGDTSITYYEPPTAYTRGSASGGIASFSGANTEFPLTKLKATIAPSVEGVTVVNAYNEGKNLVDGSNFTRGLPSTTIGSSIDNISTSTRYSFYGAHIGGGNYTISSVSEDADYYNSILIYGYSNGILTVYTNSAINTNKTVDFGSCNYVRIAIGTRNSTITVPTDFTEYGTIQLEVGSSPTEYTAYKAPTVYTADLGETVYGGSVDFVSGEVKDSNDNTFYIDPQEIYPREGVNNIWNDANGDTEVTYFEEE